jgi:hypothetical protein
MTADWARCRKGLAGCLVCACLGLSGNTLCAQNRSAAPRRATAAPAAPVVRREMQNMNKPSRKEMRSRIVPMCSCVFLRPSIVYVFTLGSL